MQTAYREELYEHMRSETFRRICQNDFSPDIDARFFYTKQLGNGLELCLIADDEASDFDFTGDKVALFLNQVNTDEDRMLMYREGTLDELLDVARRIT